MSIFTNPIASAAVIKKAPAKKKIARIFDKYVALTLEKLERSLSDAQGRYEEGRAYSSPVPSQNWRVRKAAPKGASLLEEKVECFLKIGIKKMVVGENGETVLGPIPAANLVPALEFWKQMVESIKEDPSSEAAKAFHAEAIEQARPKTNAGNYVYSTESDSYVAKEEPNLKSVS